MTFDEVSLISREELAYWVAHLRMNPTTTDALTVLAAILNSLIVNVAGGKSKPKDHLVNWSQRPPSEEEKRVRAEDAALRLKAGLNAMGKRRK